MKKGLRSRKAKDDFDDFLGAEDEEDQQGDQGQELPTLPQDLLDDIFLSPELQDKEHCAICYECNQEETELECSRCVGINFDLLFYNGINIT